MNRLLRLILVYEFGIFAFLFFLLPAISLLPFANVSRSGLAGWAWPLKASLLAFIVALLLAFKYLPENGDRRLLGIILVASSSIGLSFTVFGFAIAAGYAAGSNWGAGPSHDGSIALFWPLMAIGSLGLLAMLVTMSVIYSRTLWHLSAQLPWLGLILLSIAQIAVNLVYFTNSAYSVLWHNYSNSR